MTLKNHAVRTLTTLWLLVPFLSFSLPAFSQATDLFFSEYIEGSSNNKALEIYNGTGAAADLTEYTVELYSNGSATPGNTLALSDAAANLADGDVLVIANGSADAAIQAVADITSSVTFFNGDDAIALLRNGVIIDVIGVIGSDPGSEWGSGDISTGENTIVRLASVCGGDANGFDNPADISDQWSGFPQNTFDNLGAHTANCAAPTATDLLFSEYVEGSSNNKALEIYNGTGAVADLSEYTVETYFNGSASPGQSLTLSSAAATLADGAALVIANSSAVQAVLDAADITSAVANFNGDDAVVLRRNGVIIDVIGVIGSDPGSLWGTAPVVTQNATIRRLATVCAGDVDGFDNPADISDQWEGFAIDTFDGLGAHTLNCGVVVNAPVLVNCGGDVDLSLGVGGSQQVSASDADGVIASIAVTNVTPAPAAGSISAANFIAGDPATADIVITSDVPQGSYTVEVTATNSDASAQTGSCTLTVNIAPPPTPGWVINEFLADPAGDLTGDANGDGVRDSSDDEFVEIVNNTGDSRDISNYTIADGFGQRHVFPAGTVLADGAAIVVFGGDTPTGAFGGATVQTASGGSLGLNNGGDTITFASDQGVVQAEITYGGEGGNNQSLTLDPDVDGTAYVEHSTATGSNGALFSPGTRIDGSPFGPTGAEDLFFSEYIEGSSNNKALEIYNGTGETADLSEYSVQRFSNGASTAGATLVLSDAAATLADGEVLVIANSSAVQAILDEADITSGVTSFNGDDAIALLRNGVIIDVIGVIGSDPGSFWGTAPVVTQNASIRRLATVCAGDADGFDNPADISDQWEGFAIDTFDGLGAHVALCGTTFNQPISLNCSSGLTVEAGVGGSGTVTADDADSVVDEITITGVTPTPAAGSITAGVFTPAAAAGGVASLEIIVSADVPTGSYVLDIFASNADTPEQTTTCQFTVNATGVLPIHGIQGSGLNSPVAEAFIATTGVIVTGLTSDGFFIQEPDSEVDADPNTAEGMFVLTGGAPSGLAVGDVVDVSGVVTEFFGRTQFNSSVSFSVVSSGAALPSTTLITPADASASGSANQLEKFEGMIVRVENALATGPSNRFSDAHVTLTGSRAFREKGVEAPGLPGLPVWDGNPEIIEVDPDRIGFPDVQIIAGATVTAEGPLNFTFGDYQVAPFAITVVNPADPARAVRARQPGEFTVGGLNALRLFQGQPSASGYADRLVKFSRFIREVMDAPEILAFSEVEGIGVLTDLAAQIQSDDASLAYTANLIEGNDIGGIDVGFLTLATVQVNAVSQIEPNGMFDFNGDLRTLHDRPPLVLDAAYTGGAQPFPITAIAIHNRSLIDVEDVPGGEFARAKRLAQAESIATAVQNLQTADPNINLTLIGDFNAFQFTDGFVDVMGVITGNLDPAASFLPGSDLVNPDLVNHVVATIPADERYSFNSDGNNQVLDHVLTSQALTAQVTGAEFARGNADAPPALLNDASTVLRTSDHDGIVLFINPTPPATEAVIDNLDPDFAVVGDWTSSTAIAGFFNTDYFYSPKGDGSSVATWTLNFPVSGQYQVLARWTAHPNRATNALYTVTHDGGVSALSANQKRDGGKFNRLGTFFFTAGQSYTVTLDNNANGFVIADAIRWERYEPVVDNPDDVIIDNIDARFETNSVWANSTVVPGFFADNYQYNNAGTGAETATWTVNFDQGGAFQVFARWTAHPNRATNATYTVEHDGGLSTATVNQKQNGGEFRLLGVFNFSAGVDYGVTLTDDANGFVIADAIRFTRVPATGPGEIVVDNGDPAFNANGNWPLSTSVAGFLGANYQYNAAGSGADIATWTGVIAESGSYEVYARWTAHPNRATNATYRIEHAGGTANATVDQTQNGGQWILLGVFSFNGGAGYTVTLDDDADGFVIADGVRWVKQP